MIKEARQRALLEQLREHQVASTATLSEALKASTTTVRRDLDELSALGLIVRVFGGARLASENPLTEKVDDPFDEVLARGDEGKRAIAGLVAQQITPGSTVFLEAGTTTYRVAEKLLEHDLTVVTNSLRIADLLVTNPGTELIMLGGHVNREYMSVQGATTTAEIANLQIDVAVPASANAPSYATPTREVARSSSPPAGTPPACSSSPATTSSQELVPTTPLASETWIC